MSKQPLVSIIIPTYNRAHLIGETLDSLLAQTYQNWECIVVDDGSTDATEVLLAKYTAKDARFKYYQSPKTYLPGGNGARNYGFEKSNGDYVNWFDSDDVMYPQKIATQITLLHNTTYDYTVCQTLMYDVVNDKPLGLRAQHIISNEIFNDFICFKVFWFTPSALWKRSFLLAHQLKYDETLTQSQDYDFHIRVMAISTHYNTTDEVLIQVNCHEGNMSVSLVDSRSKLMSNLKVKGRILSVYKSQLYPATQQSVYNDILRLYRDAVLARSLNKILLVGRFLFQYSKASGLSFVNRVHLCCKLSIGALCYLSIGKGYAFINHKI